MKQITILHIFSDEKFFDGVSRFFDALENVNNIYVFYTPDKDFNFTYIKRTDVVKVVHDMESYAEYLSHPDIDIIYLQSLNPDFYPYFQYIDDAKKIIWWCFGFEIYQYYTMALQPLVPITLYKPLTKKHIDAQSSWIYRCAKYIYHNIKFRARKKLRKQILSRIDYFSPVLSSEYQLMCDHVPQFKAKPFMLSSGPGMPKKSEAKSLTTAGNILVGNSLTLTNNHLDIAAHIRDFNIGERKYIFPISYGSDYKNTAEFQRLLDLPEKNTLFMEGFIPFAEYTQIFDSISHAIFGHMRQQAMGNIFLSLRNGIKVYLYSESIAYKYLKSAGYKVFSIEDLTESSLQIPLGQTDSYHNHELSYRRNENKFERTAKELQRMFD